MQCLFIEFNCVVFFYVSKDALKVALEGDWTRWKPRASLVYLPDTPQWYRIENFPKDARLDPSNPQFRLLVFRSQSESAIPGYRQSKELADRSSFQRGTLEQHWIKSEVLGDRRSFWINLPPRYDHTKRYPVVYFNDGKEYLYSGDVPRIMDYLIEHRKMRPFIAALVRPNNREKEYGLSSQSELCPSQKFTDSFSFHCRSL